MRLIWGDRGPTRHCRQPAQTRPPSATFSSWLLGPVWPTGSLLDGLEVVLLQPLQQGRLSEPVDKEQSLVSTDRPSWRWTPVVGTHVGYDLHTALSRMPDRFCLPQSSCTA